ncbi:hypothetical protein AB4Z50_13555 [Paenibacillus sp. 2TAB26]|uniref:hypothetical protein n=1 Tax=Paenibacillus sp. 2TAB26 TaxID=3233005 RepID=UPI003F9CDD8F
MKGNQPNINTDKVVFVETYKQDIKERSREMIWEHAVYSLTSNRSNNRVLKEEYIRNLWNYIFYKCKYTKNYFLTYQPDVSILNSWCDFANNTYGFKKASDLKVVYLCGPEPENDLHILLRLGVRIENIWAIEADKGYFNTAIENIRNNYPILKVFHGSIETFFKIYPMSFDIIYLDFTAPLFSKEKKPFSTIHTIFDNQILSELGVLITNSSVPDKTDEGIDFLADFFVDQRYLEGNVHGAIDNNGDLITWFGDGVGQYYGTGNKAALASKIADNFEGAYSSFCSVYPIFYANVVSPDYRVSNERVLFEKLFNNDEAAYNKFISQEYRDEYMIYEDYPQVGFVERINSSDLKLSKYWDNVYRAKEAGGRCNRSEAVRVSALLRSGFSRGDTEIYSPTLLKSVKETYKIMDEIEKKRLFCDIIFPDILTEIALNQLGLPYHPQMFNHRRYSYTAKKRKMFTDIFTFDRCRAFYDWIPLIEFYGANVATLERQMILRSCIDAIGGKQLGFTPIPVYDSGVSVIGMFEEEWAKFIHGLPARVEL